VIEISNFELDDFWYYLGMLEQPISTTGSLAPHQRARQNCFRNCWKLMTCWLVYQVSHSRQKSATTKYRS